MQPLVDVVVISYPSHIERVRYLQKCCQSIRDLIQGDVGFRCSLESRYTAPDMLQRAHKICTDMGIVVVEHAGKPGMSNHINYAIATSKASYVFVINDDRTMLHALNVCDACNVCESYPTVVGINYGVSVPNPDEYVSAGFLNNFAVVDKGNSPWVLGVDQVFVRSTFVEDTNGGFYGAACHGWASRNMDNRLREMDGIVLFSREPYFEHCGTVRCNGLSPWRFTCQNE